MKLATYKSVLLMLFLSLTLSVNAQKIPIQILPSGHIVAKATVEGKEGNFIFDTGGGINLFFDSFAKDFKPTTSYNSLTAYRATGERLDVSLYESKNLQFAGKTFANIPYATFDMKLNGIDGLISLQMFADTDFIIDYENKELILTDLSKLKNPKSFALQLYTHGDKSTDISTYILLDGKYKIQVLLDSGAGNDSFWLNGKLIETLGIERDKLKLTERKSEFDENLKTKFYSGEIASIANQFVMLNQPKVTFVDGLIYEGKTSINWFGKKIGISLKQKKMYILD
ncbi:MAG: hypothetical protein EOO42_05720 [Flavobacteriales bacterium]|nr:MAG: hypothetical protein EOO42_05720 [Flavobacteriales bacterium]